MKRLRSLKYHIVEHSTPVLQEEKEICTKYALRSKKDLGKYKFLLRKYHGLGRREGFKSKPYLLAKESLIRKGILQEGQEMSTLRLEDFLERRLIVLASKMFNLRLNQTRNLISAGKIWYRGKRSSDLDSC